MIRQEIQRQKRYRELVKVQALMWAVTWPDHWDRIEEKLWGVTIRRWPPLPAAEEDLEC